ncbi:MAG: WbuC family cupin fold metalloprotein [Bacteroidales bacterium]|mgnify:CR=1 FL=1|nr:WbuC family cupin fold metalloprotein [Bacteroidales bacterium]
MVIDNKFLDTLLEQAANSERKRTTFDARTSSSDNSQRAVNAMIPGTIVPIHRHRKTSETFSVLKGKLTSILFDDNGNETERFELGPSTGNLMMMIPAGTWHTVEVNEPCVIFEAKDGAYEPVAPEDVMQR